ncbi:MAG: hypothetical protein GF334_03470 [Candidatus Altiarchaeales archaeon]|nr:hypothetical protein [Candidatus Altiarchaeales archaeon]
MSRRLFSRSGGESCCVGFLVAFALGVSAYIRFWGFTLPEFDLICNLVSHSQKNIQGLVYCFTQPQNNYLSTSVNYRPIPALVLWFTHLLFGFNLHLLHWINFLLHGLNTALVYVLTKKLLRGKKIFPLASAALFAYHPIHLQTVLFASRMPEPLVLFGMLLSLLSIMRYVEGAGKKYYVSSIGFCFIAIFSKPTGALTPLILLLYLHLYVDWNLKRKIKTITPHLTLIPLYFILMYSVLGGLGGYGGNHIQFRYSVLNLVTGLLDPTDQLKISYFPKIYSLTSQWGIQLLFYVGLAAGSLFLLYKIRGKKNLVFPATTFLLIALAYLASQMVVNPWYLYILCAPYSITLATYFSQIFDGDDFVSKIQKTVFFVYLFVVILHSPLLRSYTAFHSASQTTGSYLDQIVNFSEDLPKDSTLYLVNTPEYLVFKGKGYPYSCFMASEASVKALLDYHYPGKNLKTYSLLSSTLASEGGAFRVSSSWRDDCILEALNRNRRKATLKPSVCWMGDCAGKRGFPVKRTPRGWEVFFSEDKSKDAFVLTFNGAAVSGHPLELNCGGFE